MFQDLFVAMPPSLLFICVLLRGRKWRLRLGNLELSVA